MQDQPKIFGALRYGVAEWTKRQACSRTRNPITKWTEELTYSAKPPPNANSGGASARGDQLL